MDTPENREAPIRANFGSGLVPRLLSVASALVIVGAGSFITLQAGTQGF